MLKKKLGGSVKVRKLSTNSVEFTSTPSSKHKSLRGLYTPYLLWIYCLECKMKPINLYNITNRTHPVRMEPQYEIILCSLTEESQDATHQKIWTDITVSCAFWKAYANCHVARFVFRMDINGEKWRDNWQSSYSCIKRYSHRV